MKKQKCIAIILAAGQGKRMGTKVQKQYLEIHGYPVLYYSLRAFQACEVIDEIILVTGIDEIESCEYDFVKKYAFTKVISVIAGGKERYDSVYNGLQHIGKADYIFIHDGARPMISDEIIINGFESVKNYDATVAGVPSKDTVKIIDENGFSSHTPDRKTVWNVQTPQIFEAKLICRAYEEMMKAEHSHVTDDAMVVETYVGHKVKIYEASYENIKITTQEDLEIAEIFLK